MKRILLTLGLIVSSCGLFASQDSAQHDQQPEAKVELSAQPSRLSKAWSFVKAMPAPVAANSIYAAAPAVIAFGANRLTPVAGSFLAQYLPEMLTGKNATIAARVVSYLLQVHATKWATKKFARYSFGKKRVAAKYTTTFNIATAATLANGNARLTLGGMAAVSAVKNSIRMACTPWVKYTIPELVLAAFLLDYVC